MFLGKSQTGTRTTGFGLVQTGFQSVWDRTSPTLVTLLHPYDDDPITECQECHLPPPPLVVRNSIEEYEVKKILDSRIFRGKVEYLVHWKGYGVEEDEWRPSRDVRGSKRLVAEFHCTHPQAPRP